jgi:UDP-N-acetylmuramyl pentapeptide phosphotransferase/UDP-N-acetylglucosamine-1-phosphate transferase
VPRGYRKRHAGPTRLAGLVPGAAAAALVIVLAPAAWLAGAGILLAAATGHFDDLAKRRGAGWSWRAKGTLLLAASLLAFAGVLPPERWFTPAGVGALALLFVLANAVNFLDNQDGVSLAVGGLGLVLAGGEVAPAVGFLFLGLLPLNWPRAVVFPGDAGALALGLALGCFCVARGEHDGSHRAALAPCVVPLLDFVQVVCVRIWLGYPPWVGDRRHLTHIAIAAGMPERWVAPVFAGLVALGYLLLAPVV